jgi:hypothetical protein
LALLAKGVKEFRDALQSKSLTALTQALSKIAEGLAYQMRPPYTEILEFNATEQADRYAIHFRARLGLHYSSFGATAEGLVFKIEFGGDALSDSPTPPTDELFYAGRVQSLQVYGYGSIWPGIDTPAPKDLRDNLELHSKTIRPVDLRTFQQILSSRER